jgi:hypothetical protein
MVTFKTNFLSEKYNPDHPPVIFLLQKSISQRNIRLHRPTIAQKVKPENSKKTDGGGK